MAADCLPAKSFVEASLYFLVTPCPVCQSDRLDPQDPTSTDDSNTVAMVGVCRNCGSSESFRFAVENLPHAKDRHDPISGTHAINLGFSHSRLIDLVQWVTLHEILLEKAKSQPNVAEARWLKVRAGQCLDEAAKFFDAGIDAPPKDATFIESSLKKINEHPDRYKRSRLSELRSQLPSENAFDEVQSKGEPERPWWKIW